MLKLNSYGELWNSTPHTMNKLVILDPAETIEHLKVLVANGPEKCRAFGRS